MQRRSFVALVGSAALGQPVPNPVPGPDLDWHDARKFTVEGLGFADRKSPYDRLPGRAEGVVRQAVWDLSRDSSGVLVRFVASTATIRARWTVTGKTLAAATITAVASSGLDLYAKDDAGHWRWLGIGRPMRVPDNVDTLAAVIPATRREYMIYLPLRNGVASLEIGVTPGSPITAAPTRPAGRKSIAFYATSITHGISASRPGMTHPAILGRLFNREIINLGFSGNGRMEPEVTKFFAELDPAVFVLDCLPNMNAQDIAQRAETCVKILRQARPQTPILLVEDRNYADNFLVVSRRERNETNHVAMQKVYTQLKQDKVPHLHYLKADHLLGDDGEGTIDGSHPTDLGFVRQAKEFERALRKILKS